MSEHATKLTGLNLEKGVATSDLSDGGMLLGHAHGEPVLLVRRGSEYFAVGAVCTHYGAPLEQGLLVGATVRCPWHHACFDLRNGQAIRAPALTALPSWRVEVSGTRVRVREKLTPSAPRPSTSPSSPPRLPFIVLGGGAAGNAAAEMLRQEGYDGAITMLSADESVPYDRPNLSKSYLSGSAPPEWIPLRSKDFYKGLDIDLKLRANAVAIDTAARHVQLDDGSRHKYGALLLATGADPVRLDIPGADLSHVHYLRTLADGGALIAAASKAKRAVVIGSSFIGLEVAASLRARDIEVQVVGLEPIPFERVLGVDVGTYLCELHESHGVTFHLSAMAAAIDKDKVTLKNGEELQADLVVVGIGVRPSLALAERSGLAIDRGVLVDEYLATSAPDVFAAGDIARWPDRLSGELIRVEHWVVAERQGQTAARNMLGRRERFVAVPFFWTEHYDFSISYIGHAEKWDDAQIDGRLDARDCTITYTLAGRKLAVATVHRDLEGLRAEHEFEQTMGS